MKESNSINTGLKTRIAVATNDQKRITGHIGRCKSFMIYDIDGDKILSKEFRENTFTNHVHGKNMHHHHDGTDEHRDTHQGLINGLNDCNYLISKGGGWRVVEDLKEHDIITLFTDTELIEDAVNKFITGELKNDTHLVCDHSKS